MISDGSSALNVHPFEVLLPSIVLTIIVLAFSFLGDGLRDAFDPRSKIRKSNKNQFTHKVALLACAVNWFLLFPEVLRPYLQKAYNSQGLQTFSIEQIGETPLEIDTDNLSAAFVRDLYTRMLVMRIVDEYTCALYQQGHIGFVASCRGHEAAQVGSAVCIEVGKDFTLPYYRDLGVVLTIGMTPYEIFRTHIQSHRKQMQAGEVAHSIQEAQAGPLWGYQKHNMVAGSAPVATQILHAAGIAFASKLRKASAITIAYCGDGAITETIFLKVSLLPRNTHSPRSIFVSDVFPIAMSIQHPTYLLYNQCLPTQH